ncbi:MAG: pyruvate kinase [bacterium]
MRKTRIVCTIGPASSSREMLKKLIESGMNVARLNFSHGSHEEHLEVIKILRELSGERKIPVAILQDLCGPKIRTGEVAKPPINLVPGREIILTTRDVPGDEKEVSISYHGLPKDVQPGNRIFVDDGLFELEVEKSGSTDILCRVINGGSLLSHKGLNLPGVRLSVPAVTEKDLEDLAFGLEAGVDFVALSFVRESDDVLRVKEEMAKSGASIPVIAKIEKHEAVKNIEEILQLADGIMVARGDLGAEVAIEEVPLIQKMLIRRCNELSKPVITATQMLDSMIRNPRPTRAEVTDVANAIFDGTDAVMLSGETASGKYPLEALRMMSRIAERVEGDLPCRCMQDSARPPAGVTEAISLATCRIAEELSARAILVFTSSGRTARVVSRYKPKAHIIAATKTAAVQRRLILSWGVFPLLLPEPGDTDALMEAAESAAHSSGLVDAGDLMILTAGIPPGGQGSTNMIKIQVIGHTFVRGSGIGKEEVISGIIRKASNPVEAESRVQDGDILMVARVEEGYSSVKSRLKGIISRDDQPESPAERMVLKWEIPSIFGVPGAQEMFKDGDAVTLDVTRGLIYRREKEL